VDAGNGGDHKGDAVITRRSYLADAVFVVAVTGEDTDIARIAGALHQPHWNPYLGRRSCVPDEPFLLRGRVADPVRELLEQVPLSPSHAVDHWETPEQEGKLPVDFIWETYPLGSLPDNAVTATLTDRPISFAQHGRSHAQRQIRRTTEFIAAGLRADQDVLHQRLIDYAKDTEREET